MCHAKLRQKLLQANRKKFPLPIDVHNRTSHEQFSIGVAWLEAIVDKPGSSYLSARSVGCNTIDVYHMLILCIVFDGFLQGVVKQVEEAWHIERVRIYKRL